MSRRTSGTILPLEEAILAHGIDHADFYGFALARAISDGASALTAHGTLYKALTRMTSTGLLEARWEDANVAETEGRPRRRLYRVTADGAHALSTARAHSHTVAAAAAASAATKVALA